MLSEAEHRELDEILKKYPDKQSAILAALYIVQRRQNYLTENDIRDVAQALELNITEVQAIVGFYTLFRKESTGTYMIQVCTDLPCALRGAEEFYRRLCERLGLPPQGGTTDDGLFTVEQVVCLAACDKAPVAQINLEYYESLTDEGMDAVIAGLRQESSEEVPGA